MLSFLISLATLALLAAVLKRMSKSSRHSRKKQRGPTGLSPDAKTWRTTDEQIEADQHRRTALVKRREAKVLNHSSTTPDPEASAWTMELLRVLEWKRFEEVCEQFWCCKGYTARCTGAGADGGVDIVISAGTDATKMFAVAQCKSWSKPVGVTPVRELWGSTHHFGAKLALFYSLSGFTSDATNFAIGKHLKLISGQDLLHQIKDLSDAQQTELLTHATRGDYKTPSCPQCETKMVHRSGQNNRRDFWGCPRFPKCKSKPIPMRGSV